MRTRGVLGKRVVVLTHGMLFRDGRHNESGKKTGENGAKGLKLGIPPTDGDATDLDRVRNEPPSATFVDFAGIDDGNWHLWVLTEHLLYAARVCARRGLPSRVVVRVCRLIATIPRMVVAMLNLLFTGLVDAEVICRTSSVAARKRVVVFEIVVHDAFTQQKTADKCDDANGPSLRCGDKPSAAGPHTQMCICMLACWNVCMYIIRIDARNPAALPEAPSPCLGGSEHVSEKYKYNSKSGSVALCN